jgi:iron complex outermembrane recepter protein
MPAKALRIAGGIPALTLCLAQPAMAEKDGKPADTGAAAIPEIIVTANKRSESINNVGLAITAATGRQLASQGVVAVPDLVRIEPSLHFSQSQSGTPVYTLRGVGYFEQSLSATPTVSIYQNEVAYPYPVMAHGVMLDLDRVEILKGPQGTLYGQNATGGAINFIAAAPTQALHAGIDASIGRFADGHLAGYVTGGLTPTLRARLAGSLDVSGPWQKSVTTGASLGRKDSQAGRLILDWTPTSRLTATLTLAGWLDRSDTQAGQLEGFRIQAPQNLGPGNASDPGFYLPAPVGSAAFAAYPAPLQAVFAQPVAPANARAADWLAGTRPRNDEDFYQANLRLEYTVSDTVGLTSLTSFQHFREDNGVDQAGVSVPAESSVITGHVTTFSQELRLHGKDGAGRFNWLIGANYESDKSDEFDTTAPFVSSASYSPTALGLPPFFEFSALNTDLARTYSAFVNAEYRVISQVSVHAGVRYTQSDQQLSGCSASTYPSVNIIQAAVGAQSAAYAGGTSGPAIDGQCITLGPPPNFVPGLQRNTLNQHNVPWRLGIDYKPAPRALVYVSVSKGYKAGSSPALGASQYYQLTPVTQESLLSYEAGIKTDLFGRLAHVDLSAFHYDYTDKQELGRVQDPVYGSLQTLLNIPKSKEDGVEASLVLHPATGLSFNAAATWLNARVTSDFRDFGPYPLGATDQIDFKGEPFPYTPKWSGQWGARYEWPVSAHLMASVAADGSWQSRANATFGADEARADNAPLLEIKPYALLNLAAGLADPAHGWRLEIWGKNVTNTFYWHSVNYVSDTTVRLTGMPVTYGVRFRVDY